MKKNDKKIDKALTKFEELAGHSVPVFLEMSSHDRALAWYNYRIVNDSSNWSLSDSQYLVDIQEFPEGATESSTGKCICNFH